MSRSFLPGPRVSNLVIGLAMAGLAWALYMRYALMEPSSVGLACAGGLETSTCVTRRVVLNLFENSVFGIVAIVFAAIQVIRPSVTGFTIGLTATAIGVVLYNNNLSSLAAGLLLISFARPWPSARS